MPDSNSPKVSIIMPTYNLAGYILETIESVCNQDYKNWELIIVDDGSDDNTQEIVEGLNDPRIQFVNAGRIGIGGIIKNIGLQKATGDFFAFIDADDVWATTKLEKQLNALQKFPEAGFCLTGGYNFTLLNVPVEYFYKQREGFKTGNVFLDYFKSELPVFTQALLLRKECLTGTGPFKVEKRFSDLDFMLTLAYRYDAVILYEPLFYRRLHNNNYSNISWEESYREGIEMIHSCKQRKMIEPAIANGNLFNVYINFGEDCLRYKNSKKAIGCFFKAWKNKPISIVPLKKMGKAILSNLKNKY
ncbi:hypothetical protein BH11BAC4_BH11BAC4_07140 [soil metagenome]